MSEFDLYYNKIMITSSIYHFIFVGNSYSYSHESWACPYPRSFHIRLDKTCPSIYNTIFAQLSICNKGSVQVFIIMPSAPLQKKKIIIKMSKFGPKMFY